MSYVTTTELSKKWNISSRKIAYYCEVGRISGAVKKANVWLIPANAQRPIDKRKAPSTLFDVAENIAKKGIASVNNKVENDDADNVYYPGAIYKHFGLTRDTLIYYEKIGLIAPKRKIENLYREFDSGDMFQFMTIDFYKKRGFTLLEIKNLIKHSTHDDSSAILEKKLVDLKEEIYNQQRMFRRLKETKDLHEYARDMDGKFEIKDFPLFSVLKSFDNIYDVSNYDKNILRALDGEDILSNTIRAISFDNTGYTGSKICVVKKVTAKCDSKQRLFLESGQCIYVLTIKSPDDDTYEKKMFFAIQKWAHEQGIELKGIAYSFIRLLEENNRRVLYEIWIPIK